MDMTDWKILKNCGGEWHSHAHAHLLLPLSKTLVVSYDSQVLKIAQNELGYVPPQRYHLCQCPENVIVINIPQHMVRTMDSEILERNPVIALEGIYLHLTNLIKSEVINNPDGCAVRHLYYYLYEKLIEASELQSVRYINNHYFEQVTIRDLARLENYHTSYFSGWFYQQTGYKPAHYLRHVRIEAAKELLQSTDLRIIDIAVQVGYNSNAAFSHAFRAVTGISPDQYRKCHKS